MPSILPRRLDRRSIPALLLAGALVVSAGVGGATAGALITGRDIADGSITSADIADRTLGTRQISTEAIARLSTRWNAGRGAPSGKGASTGTWYLDTVTGDAYKKTARGWAFRVNIMGDTGATGATGEQGSAGLPGTPGTTGTTGPVGPRGLTGQVGPQGEVGAQGTIGVAGADAVSAYAEFFALAPPDNASTVATGANVSFPQDGPHSDSSGPITRLGAEMINLRDVGIYRVSFSVPVSEQGQLVVVINGNELPYTVVGRATGTSAITGEALVQTTNPDSLLTVQNPAGNPTGLTITPLAGGNRPVASTLIIEQLG